MLLAVNSVPSGKFLPEQELVEYVEYCCVFLKCAVDLWGHYLIVLTAKFHILHKSKWNNEKSRRGTESQHSFHEKIIADS